MKILTTLLESFYKKGIEYVKTNIELLKLKIIRKILALISSLLAAMIIITIVLFFMIFSSLGLAIWIGQLLNEIYYGFFIVGGFYFIIGFILYVFRKELLKKPLNNILVKLIV